MMDKTIKINLGGTLFHIDEEAYKILRRYLQDIDNRLKYTPGGAETLDDIESRIAEIFQTQGGTAGVISRENVEAMISVIGKPEDFETLNDEEIPNGTFSRSATRKKMFRNPDDTIISGVCGGIGEYLNIDSVWIRLMFILFACFFGTGFFVYIALWIALPSANTDAQKREMYGRDDYAVALRTKKTYSRSGNDSRYPVSGARGSSVGNAFNEVFRALGNAFYIVLRVFLIIIGSMFVVAGFFILVSFVMVFFFKYPGYFSTQSFGANIFYLPDFLNYIVNPAIAPWILVLSFIVILLPLLAIIYWGIKMIFLFRARDGIFSLVGLVIWVMCLAALSILLFNEGISFAETARIVSEEVVEKAPADLYIMSDHKVSGLRYDKEISIPDEDYAVYFIDNNRGLFISSTLTISNSDDNSLRIAIRKHSAGRSRPDATRKAEELIYNYRIAGDTIYLDEYFTIPAGSKWSFDNVKVDLYIPEGTAVHFDQTTGKMLRQNPYISSDDNEWAWDSDSDEKEYLRSGNGNSIWIMTEDGLKRKSEKTETTR